MVKKDDNKFKCTGCEEYKDFNEYYSSSSFIYKSSGKLSVCKQCLWTEANKGKLNDDNYNLNAIKFVLMSINKPFISDLWDASISESRRSKVSKDIFKIYMKNLGLKQNRELTWVDGDVQVSSNIDVDLSFDNVKQEIDLTQDDINEMMKFWGRGFDLNSYIWLQNEFEDFLARYECDSKGMELLIKQICLTELDIEIRRGNNEKVDQQLKTLQDLLGSSNLKPVQETGANALDQESFGTLIKKYENERPIPEPEEVWEDVDGIKKYINVWFLGHLCKMLGIENTYSQLYDHEIRKFTVEPPSESYIGGDD